VGALRYLCNNGGLLRCGISELSVIEAQVHQRLRAFLREYGEPSWPHHLTLARLVARALRLGRSALLQVGGLSAYQGHYRLSYLVALLMWPGPAILVVPAHVKHRLLMSDLPQLQEKLLLQKSIQTGDQWPAPDFSGLLITTPEVWLADRLHGGQQFPDNIPTLFDEVDHLETWVLEQLTVNINSLDWNYLALAFPDHQDLIRNTQVALTHSAFQHPPNPYHGHQLTDADHELLQQLHRTLVVHEKDSSTALGAMPSNWQRFWQQFSIPDRLLWYSVDREQGQVILHCVPLDMASALAQVWQKQPVVLIGAALDQSAKAENFRQRFGLDDLTCLKFSPHRHNDVVQLYIPDHLPLPNTPQFQAVIHQEIRRLLSCVKPGLIGPTLVLLEDLPLKGQLAAALAGEYGSRVQVEQTNLHPSSILVSGWKFWHQHRDVLPTPSLIIIATLPLPSLEHPLVAGRVAYHKRLRQDWFRLYLFPTAVTELQRAIAPLRAHPGGVALLDTRVHYRSYGRQLLDALSPLACSRSLHPDWLLDMDTHPPEH
jgi:ATP-dependent DNA helicase DinG